jgi:hypothetical protein
VLARLSTACIFLSNARAIQSIAPSSFTFTHSIPPAARSEVCAASVWSACGMGEGLKWGVHLSKLSRPSFRVERVPDHLHELRFAVHGDTVAAVLASQQPRAVSTHSRTLTQTRNSSKHSAGCKKIRRSRADQPQSFALG